MASAETAHIILQLFVVFAGAKVLGGLAHLVRIPSLVGELTAGILLANTMLGPALGVSADLEMLRVLAELGVIFLLFVVGLETPFEEMRKVGGTSTAVAILGVVLPFAAGYLLMYAIGAPSVQALFLGAALVATSVGITARVLADLGVLGGREARIIIGAAVIDDVLGLTILTVVEAIGAGGALEPWRIGFLLFQAVVFVGLLMYFGGRLTRRVLAENPIARRYAWASPNGALYTIAIVVCLGLSVLAASVGLAAIIGAFLAGMAFASSERRHDLLERFEGIVRFLTPFFFGYIGLQVQLAAALDAWQLAVVVTALALVTKVVGCGVAALRLGRPSALAIGIGMMPRGEVGIIVALIGLSLNVIPPSLYAVVVTMSIATTILTPPLLVWAFRRLPAKAPAA